MNYKKLLFCTIFLIFSEAMQASSNSNNTANSDALEDNSKTLTQEEADEIETKVHTFAKSIQSPDARTLEDNFRDGYATGTQRACKTLLGKTVQNLLIVAGAGILACTKDSYKTDDLLGLAGATGLVASAGFGLKSFHVQPIGETLRRYSRADYDRSQEMGKKDLTELYTQQQKLTQLHNVDQTLLTSKIRNLENHMKAMPQICLDNSTPHGESTGASEVYARVGSSMFKGSMLTLGTLVVAKMASPKQNFAGGCMPEISSAQAATGFLIAATALRGFTAHQAHNPDIEMAVWRYRYENTSTSTTLVAPPLDDERNSNNNSAKRRIRFKA